MTELDPSIDAFEAGRHRLRIISLDVYMGDDGFPCLRQMYQGGSSSVIVSGIPLPDLQAAAAAFNDRIFQGGGAAARDVLMVALPDPDGRRAAHDRMRSRASTIRQAAE